MSVRKVGGWVKLRMRNVPVPSPAVPASHGAHTVFVVAVHAEAMYSPTAHVEHVKHEACSAAVWYVEPAEHAVQSSTEPALEYPAAQGSVPVLKSPVRVTSLPALIVVQKPAPSSENVPVPHGLQDVSE
jgi:hypothetical protein